MGKTSDDQRWDEVLNPCSQFLPNNYKKRVIDLLKENSLGLTIADLSKKLETTRHTVSIALAELKGADLIEIRKVGVAKLHVLKPLEEEMLKQLCLTSFKGGVKDDI